MHVRSGHALLFRFSKRFLYLKVAKPAAIT
jgi:hypothetical protein